MKLDEGLVQRERRTMQRIVEDKGTAKSKREAARVAAGVLAQIGARLILTESEPPHVEPETWRESM